MKWKIFIIVHKIQQAVSNIVPVHKVYNIASFCFVIGESSDVFMRILTTTE